MYIKDPCVFLLLGINLVSLCRQIARNIFDILVWFGYLVIFGIFVWSDYFVYVWDPCAVGLISIYLEPLYGPVNLFCT